MPFNSAIKLLLLVLLVTSTTAIAVVAKPEGSAAMPPAVAASSLDADFAPPQGIQRFDSQEWQRSTKHRITMLIDLFQMRLLGEPMTKIRGLLGLPAHTQYFSEVARTFDDYDLGTAADKPVTLHAYYQLGRLTNLIVGEANIYDCRKHEVLTAWYDKNPGHQDIAKDLNSQYFLVGAPIDVACGGLRTLGAFQLERISKSQCRLRFDTSFVKPGLLDHSKELSHLFTLSALGDTKTHYYKPFEIDCETYNGKIARFRLLFESDNLFGLSSATDWQDNDLRKNPAKFMASAEYMNIPLAQRLFLVPGARFGTQEWATINLETRYSRLDLLFDLVHSYPLIGMSRSSVYALLGKPSFLQRKSALVGRAGSVMKLPESTDALANECDWYRLTFPSCGNAGVMLLEIAYQGDRAKAYRLGSQVFN
jgi:hypothetical protein